MENLSLEKILHLLEAVQASENQSKSIEKLEHELTEDQVSSYLKMKSCVYSNEPETWRFSCYLYYLVSSIFDLVDLDSPAANGTISRNQLNAIFDAARECCDRAMETCQTSQIEGDEKGDEYKRCFRMFIQFFNNMSISSSCVYDEKK